MSDETSEEVDLEYRGAKVKARGPYTINVLTAIIVIIVIVVATWFLESKANSRDTVAGRERQTLAGARVDQTAQIVDAINKLTESQKLANDQLEIQTWLFLQPEGKKLADARLAIRMPESLSRKMPR